jgi:fructose-1,6-bisphosphatase II
MNTNDFYLKELLEVSLQTSIETLPYFGKFDKHNADKVAVEKMRLCLQQKTFVSRIIIGEGEKDKAPMLYENELLGSGLHEIDLAVDPLECTSNFAKGLPNSMSVLAYTEKDCMHRIPGTYMEQWVASSKMKEPFQPNLGVKENLRVLAESLGKKISELRIVVQDRERHAVLISELRELNCSICLIDSGSLSCVMDICFDIGNYDAMIGIFGAPEGIISAIIAKATNSEFKGILRPHEKKYAEQWKDLGRMENEVLDKSDFVRGEIYGFVATCLSANSFLKGIQKNAETYFSNSVILKPNEIRFETTEVNRYERG